MPVLSTLDTHRAQLWWLHGAFEHPASFQCSDRLGGTAEKNQQEFQTRFHILVMEMPLFYPLCGWQSLGLSVHRGLQMSFCITSTLTLAQKNGLSVGREGFTAQNNSPGLPMDPLLCLEVSFRKHSKVLIAEPLIKAPKQPR